jgi:mannose-6-phosphate isomerase-like protein (cupin superfamily)
MMFRGEPLPRSAGRVDPAAAKTMKGEAVEPKVVSESEVAMVGPGYNDDHYISVPIKMFYDIENVGSIGVCHMEPGDETCVFALEEEDDGTAAHQYGPSDEFYYILDGEFTVWWGKDASKLDNFYKLAKGDCAYYPIGWKYKVANTGNAPGKFFYYMSSPPGIERRFDKRS